MEWTHIACMAAGGLLGSFLMTVWQNERRYRREREGEPIRIFNVCWYPKATDPPPPAPPAPPSITEGRSRGNMKCQCGGRPMPDGPPPPFFHAPKCPTKGNPLFSRENRSFGFFLNWGLPSVRH